MWPAFVRSHSRRQALINAVQEQLFGNVNPTPPEDNVDKTSPPDVRLSLQLLLPRMLSSATVGTTTLDVTFALWNGILGDQLAQCHEVSASLYYLS